jgi:uncharacterized protein DUF6766
MRRKLRDNSLSLTMLGIFLVLLVAQSIAGWRVSNAENLEHHQPTQSYGRYLRSGHFAEAVFENWESEFLQMGAYVAFTAFLIQRGSPESKKPDGDPSDADPRQSANDPRAPWPVRRGGLVLTVYEHSLSSALLLLFVLSLVAHALSGHAAYNQEQLAHGDAQVSLWSFVTSSQLWFQSFQNWQSEFLAVVVLAVLGIFLRQRGSPESKPVAAPHAQTGNG